MSQFILLLETSLPAARDSSPRRNCACPELNTTKAHQYADKLHVDHASAAKHSSSCTKISFDCVAASASLSLLLFSPSSGSPQIFIKKAPRGAVIKIESTASDNISSAADFLARHCGVV